MSDTTDDTTGLPDYAATQLAFHRAFARDLVRAVRRAGLPHGGNVLDCPCGDGFYTAALARWLRRGGRVVAADISDAYLDRAKRRVARRTDLAPVEFRKADAYALPFGDGAFDAAWCAESLISLERPVAALKELRRVVKPGGAVVVLETDEFHHAILNWPVAVELAVNRAVAAASKSDTGRMAGLSPARKVRGWLLEAGLEPGRRRTVAADRSAPFGPAVVSYLRERFAELRPLIAPHLPADALAAFDRVTDPDAGDSIFRRPDAELVILTGLYVARRPAAA